MPRTQGGAKVLGREWEGNVKKVEVGVGLASLLEHDVV